MRSTSSPSPLRRLAALALLGLTLLLGPPAEARETVDADLRVLEQVMTLVRGQSLTETDPVTLSNGGIDGLRLLLEARKLPADHLEHVPEGASKASCLAALRSQIQETSRRAPALGRGPLLTEHALNGMLKTLDDPYTIYMNPEEYSRLQEAMSGGNFGGLGIYIELDPKNQNQLTVVEPMEDTPASRAGIQPRDQIVRIDGVRTRELTIEQAKERLRGKVGSPVVLTLRRAGAADSFDVKLVREQIHVNSVKSELLVREGRRIGHLKLRMFGDRTNEEMEAAMRDLERQGAEAFILDVRNNGGGYILAALDVCSKFLPTGSRVVSVLERGSPESVHSSRPNLRRALPLAVLINEYSASASEITAGAIQDLKRGVLVGAKTFGKGSVQKIFPLSYPAGKVSALKITTAHYHTPSGKDIHKVGIEPDEKVEMKGELLGTEQDSQASRAVELLLKAIAEAPTGDPSPIPGATRVGSHEEQSAWLDRRFSGSPGYRVTDRQLREVEGVLLEEVRVRPHHQGREETFLFDLTPWLRP